MTNVVRETRIKEWFQAWLNPNWDHFQELFAPTLYYSESWGPEYTSLEEVETWFTHWHTHSTLEEWKCNVFYHIGNTTIVEWTFCCRDKEKSHKFDGVSIIVWKEEKIQSVKEFSSSLPKYNPCKG